MKRVEVIAPMLGLTACAVYRTYKPGLVDIKRIHEQLEPIRMDIKNDIDLVRSSNRLI